MRRLEELTSIELVDVVEEVPLPATILSRTEFAARMDDLPPNTILTDIGVDTHLHPHLMTASQDKKAWHCDKCRKEQPKSPNRRLHCHSGCDFDLCYKCVAEHPDPVARGPVHPSHPAHTLESLATKWKQNQDPVACSMCPDHKATRKSEARYFWFCSGSECSFVTCDRCISAHIPKAPNKVHLSRTVVVGTRVSKLKNLIEYCLALPEVTVSCLTKSHSFQGEGIACKG